MQSAKSLILGANGYLDQTTINQADMNNPLKQPLKLNLTQKFAILVGNKISERLLSLASFVYAAIVIIRIGFEQDLASAVHFFNITQLAILTLFTLEISLKILVLKAQYLKSLVNLLDLLFILCCFITVLIQVTDPSSAESFIAKLGKIFQIFRLIFIFRKETEGIHYRATRIKRKYTSVNVSTPSENVLTILTKFLHFEWVAINDELAEELSWCYEIIKSRRIYEVNISADGIENNEIVKMGLDQPEFSENPDVFSGNSANLLMHTADSSNIAILQYSTSWEFNIFNLDQEALSSSLEIITCHCFQAFDLYSSLNIPPKTLTYFIREISAGYMKDNPYHNSTHAADVTQAIYYFLTTCEAIKICSLSDLDVLICVISASIHDFQHPGFNNLFLINSLNELAIRYNDKSVLENHHLAASFKIMQDPDKNILSELSKENFRKVRGKMINVVLATDFSKHFGDISRFQARFSGGKVEDEEGRGMCMEMMMHAGDISNPTRPWELCFMWAERIMKEFYMQGDKEREMNLPISQLCDRFTVNIPKAQAGFMDLFIEPTFNVLAMVLPKVEENLKYLKENKRSWLEKNEENQ